MRTDLGNSKESSCNTAAHTHFSLSDMGDYQLITFAQNGNELAIRCLFERYRGFIYIRARSYFIIGADKEDLIQEGMIGFYKAIRDFSEGKEASFRTFAELCITRQIITAIKTATRQKHMPLNSYVSLDKPVETLKGNTNAKLMDIISGIDDPIDSFVNGEEIRSVKSDCYLILSDLETKVLKLYLESKSYQEIARDLNKRVKSVDNALQRVKCKLKTQLTSPA